MEHTEVLISFDPDSLAEEQNKKSLGVVNIIKLKRREKSKVSMCANGEPNQKFVMREEAKLPAITMEGILDTMVIDEYEYRKVATFDIPGTYLHIYLTKDKFTLLLLEGNFVDIVCDINPNYKQHVRFKYGRKILYLRILKAIYGMIESTPLWNELYMSVIKDMGFQLNP